MRYVLTGGPGSGKTTVLERLAARGLATMPEAGRAIIRDQRAIGGPFDPARDPVAFLEAILQWELRSWHAAVALGGPVFFDRGVPDVAGAYAQLGRPVPAHVRAAVEAYRYAPFVFLAPPWPEIYCHDDERTHSWESAVRTYEVMAEAYGAAGYELVELPRAPVEERVAFVLDRV